MEAKARQLESLFDRNVRYQVPLFQRLLGSIVFLGEYGLKNAP